MNTVRPVAVDLVPTLRPPRRSAILKEHRPFFLQRG